MQTNIGQWLRSGLLIVLMTGAGAAQAQNTVAGGTNTAPRGRGGFDPAQIQQRVMDNIRQKLAFTNDTEWAVVQPMVQKVVDAKREAMMSSGMNFYRLSRRSGGDSNRGGDRRPSFFGTPSPEAEALQKALDDQAPAAMIKNAMERYRASRKVKDAALAKAQEELRQVLSVRQEALAVSVDLLP